MNSTYHYHTFANGIRLIHKQTSSSVAHFGVSINAGSRDETNAENGIAHFIEHCIFKGTVLRKSFHILNRIDGVGGEMNAFTTKEETCIYASFLTNYYERTIDLFSDILFHSTFPQKELNKEREVVIDEIHSYEDNPSELIFDSFEQMMFGRHGLGRMILGTPKKVKNFQTEDILTFMKRTYCTDQMVLSSIGNIKFERLLHLCEIYFGCAENRPQKHHRTPPRNYVPKTHIEDRDTHQAHCVLGNIAYSYRNRKKTAFGILNNLLGGPALNSKLNMGIREKYGFAYNIESHYTAYSDTGLFMVYVGTDLDAIERTIELIRKEMQKMCQKALSPNQLHRYQQQIFGQMLMNLESHQNEMISIGKGYLNFNRMDTIEEIQKDIMSVTPQDILEVANEVFDEKQLSSLIFR